MGVHLPGVAGALGVDGKHDALGAESGGTLGDQIGSLDGGRVHRDFVRPGPQHGAHVGNRANPAPDGEWNEHVLRGPANDIEHGVAGFV